MAVSHRAAVLALVAAGLVGAITARSGSAPTPRSGSLAPSGASADQRIATLNVFQVVEKMVQSDRYRPARDALMKEFQGKIDAAKKDVESIANEIITAGQETEKGRALMPQYQSRKMEFDQLQQEMGEKAGEFNTQQLAEAYRLVIETANEIARSRGYTHVITTRGVAAEPIRSTNVAAAVQEIMARPVVMFPPQDDLTEAVATQLQVWDVKTQAEEEAQPGADQPAPAPQPENK